MNANDLLDMIGDVDETIIAEAKETKKITCGQWKKWAVMAACLCLILVSAVTVSRFRNNDSGSVLAGLLSDVGISTESITDPHFISQVGMPKLTSDSLMESINNNLTVQGSLVSIDTVKVVDKDSVWYVTTAEIKVDEVICGECDSKTIHIAGAACYSGELLDENEVPITSMIGCEENTNGVFVLRGLGDGAWTMNGEDISPKSLGDYSIVYYLNRSGDTLTLMQQNISVSLGDPPFVPQMEMPVEAESVTVEWAGWTIDQYLDNCSGVFRAECLSCSKKEGMTESSIAFQIKEVLYGSYDENIPEFRALFDEYYTPGKEYIIICGKESSVYSPNDYYGINAVLFETEDKLFHEGISDLPASTFAEVIAYIIDYSLKHTAGITDEPASMNSENSDLIDIYENAETVMVIEAVEEIDNSVADRTSYSYKVIDLIKGQDCDGHWLVAYKDAMVLGCKYLVMVNRPDVNSNFFVMSSQNSLFALNSFEAQEILKQIEE